MHLSSVNKSRATNTVPEDGMPMHCTTQTNAWKQKMKKNTKKLNELSLLQRTYTHNSHATISFVLITPSHSYMLGQVKPVASPTTTATYLFIVM